MESLLYGYPLPTSSTVLSRVVCASLAASLLCKPNSFVARGYRAAARLCAELCPYSPATARLLLEQMSSDADCDAFALLARLVLCFYNASADEIPLGNIMSRCMQIAGRQDDVAAFSRRAAVLLEALDLPSLVQAEPLAEHPRLFVELPHMFQDKHWYLPKVQSACQACGTVPRQPAMCLLCGEVCLVVIFFFSFWGLVISPTPFPSGHPQVVCAVDPCCAVGTRGEATLHLEARHGGIGVFLMLKDAKVFVLYKGVHGRNYPSFYLNKHGEESAALRGSPLFLNVAKYEALQTIYLENRLIDLCVDSEQYLRLPAWSSF